jgi:linoleoyl-CoA desaturase
VQVKKQLVKFAPKGENSFYDAVKARVEHYFQSNNVSVYANRKMKIKTVAMLSMYFVPYFLMVTGVLSFSLVLFYGSWIMMGIGLVGIGTSVMHDSNHGSYSTNKYINTLFGGVLNILGGYSRNWKIQHNILHHTYTNLEGLDEDIEAGILLRMSPQKPKLKFHKFQHIYAWFLYLLMNLFWVTVKDYRMLFRYEKNGMLKNQKISLRKALIELTGYKILYFTYIIALPILFTGLGWQHVVLGFLGMQMIAGLALACIFQPAHVMETSTFPEPTSDRKIEDSWAAHQMLNTTNFCPGSTITSWFIGGLNYQIEHHLFPHVCHVHYPQISAIVRHTAEEYDLPYNVEKTFLGAIIEHGKMLKLLGEMEYEPAPPQPVKAHKSSLISQSV